jgi:hypothetical protein
MQIITFSRTFKDFPSEAWPFLWSKSCPNFLCLKQSCVFVCPVAPLQGNSALPANCLPPTINHAMMAMSETKPDRIEPHAPSHIENVCSIGCKQPSVTQPRSKTVTTLNMSRCGTIQAFVFFFSICFDVILLAVCLSVFRSRFFFSKLFFAHFILSKKREFTTVGPGQIQRTTR